MSNHSWEEFEWKYNTASDTAPMHPDVNKHILPIYKDLSKDDLLKRCLVGHTQNANESFHSTAKRFTPEYLHSGLKTI